MAFKEGQRQERMLAFQAATALLSNYRIAPAKRRSMKMGNTGPFPALCREVGIA
jgi:hypothetical protein